MSNKQTFSNISQSKHSDHLPQIAKTTNMLGEDPQLNIPTTDVEQRSRKVA